jgi:CRP-like cAMP-binding protein
MKTLDGESLLAESGLEAFKRGSTFGALSDEAIRFLLGRGRILSLSDGEELFHPDDAGDSFFVVLQGQIDYFRDGVLIRTVAFGEQSGYVSMIGLFRHIGAGKAHGPTVVLEVSSDLFYQLHLELPSDFGILVLNLSRDMARALRTVGGNLVEASTGHPSG